MIVKTEEGHLVKSHDGSKVLGHYATRAQAEERLAKVEMFKKIAEAKKGKKAKGDKDKGDKPK